jgi:hypothetical protein
MNVLIIIIIIISITIIMKLLRPLAGHTLYDHKTNNSIAKNYGLQAY